MAELVALSAVVYGRVQGVYFRDFVFSIARSVGLTGYVRNLPGGRAVEVHAEGEGKKLGDLLEQLKVGPPGARVERVEVKWSDYTGDFPRFEIKYWAR
jgi:acylphosphatase